MVVRRGVALVWGLSLLFGCAKPGDEAPPVEATRVFPIPPGFGWPADSTVLIQAVADRDMATIRGHGWSLWAGINQPISESLDLPVWWTWPTTTQLFETDRQDARVLAARRAPRATPALPQPCIPEICLPSPIYPVPEQTKQRFGIQSIQDGRHFQNNGDIMVATESYSAAAAEAIKRFGYNRAATFDSLRAAGTTILQDLPPRHVVTKHMYWPVKAGALTPLPVFDGVADSLWNVYNGYETWNRFVAVDPGGGTEGQTVSLPFLFGILEADSASMPTRTVDATTISIDRFYHQRVDSAIWSQLDTNDRAMLDAAMYWTSGKSFEIGDYVVAVAMHINTKEMPSWTLQSVWWHDHPDEGPYSTDRPSLPTAQGPWQHYLMTTAYGVTTPDGSLPIAYNPYIELAASHPVATDCRNCHMRAAWPKSRAWYLQVPGPGPLADISVTDSIFAGALLLDFQWVFSDRVGG